MEREAKDVLKSYESSLEDLTFNSKPIINMLTMTADKYKAHAPEITELIESRVLKVRPEYKLPAIYLMDSIMKNLGGEYLQLFSRNIVRVFCHAFESLIDPKIRISLYRLRQTWTPFIPVTKLAAIDKHVNAIDPNWPITAKEDLDSPTIFVNPSFLNKSKSKEMKVDPSPRVTSSPKKKVSEERSQSDLGAITAVSDSIGVKPSISIEVELPSEEQSIQSKRRQLLKEQRQKKMDTKRAMGLAPSTEETKKRQRSHSPTPSSLSKRIPKIQARPRSASPTVQSETVKPSQDMDIDISQPGVRAGEKHRQMESQTAKPVEKKRKLDASTSSANSSKEIGTVRPIKQEMLELDDLPFELLDKHQKYILKQATSKLKSGMLTEAQHKSLVGQINELYSLQKKRIKQDEEKSLPVLRSQSQPQLSKKSQQVPSHPPLHPDKLHPPFNLDEPHPPLHEDQPHPPFHEDQPHPPFREDQPHPPFQRDRPPSPLSRKQPLLPPPVYDEPPQPVQEYHQHPPPPALPKSYSDKHIHPPYRPHSPPHHTYNALPPVPPSLDVPVSYHSHERMYHSREFDNDLPPPPRIPRGRVPPVPPPHDYLPPPPPHRQLPPPPSYREPRPRVERRPSRGRSRHGRSREGPPPSVIHGNYPPPRPPPSIREPAGRGVGPSTTLPVKDLFDQLVKSGILSGKENKPADTKHSHAPLPSLPEISLTSSDLRRHYSSLVDLLHRGEPCTSCGQRFLAEQQDLYQKHLDWHYQENRMDREGTKRTFRNWYLHPDDWLSFEEMSSGVPNEPVLGLEPDSKEVSAVPADEAVVSCRVHPGEGNEVCTTCEESLEQFWEEEEDEWHFKNAVRSPGGQVYHVYCYEDPSVVKPSHSQDTKVEAESTVEYTTT